MLNRRDAEFPEQRDGTDSLVVRPSRRLSSHCVSRLSPPPPPNHGPIRLCELSDSAVQPSASEPCVPSGSAASATLRFNPPSPNHGPIRLCGLSDSAVQPSASEPWPHPALRAQ